MRPVVAVAIAGALAATGAAASARAETARAAAAEALFQQAQELFANGQVEEACEKFKASQQIDRELGAQLHLADCYERIGRTASAWAAFLAAAAIAERSGDMERRRIALTRVEALEPQLSYVVLHVPPEHATAGLVTSIGDMQVPPGSWGVAIPVDPGEQRLHAVAPGRAGWTRALVVRAGATKSATLPELEVNEGSPEPVAERDRAESSAPDEHAPFMPPPSNVDSEGQARRTFGYVSGSLGLTGIGVGAFFGYRAKQKLDDSLTHCPDDPNLCSSRGVELREQARDNALASTIAFGSGAALIGTGLVLLLLQSDQRDTGLYLAPNASTERAMLELKGIW
ncbi:MAG TPA: hypothetical protein VF989_01100 [Polyangiaceae bacterium]|jgi:serine/threonine-protein kinase